ncbi:hypothetical protein [Clostridium omnivorum]|uniref:Uncharacterized protein n=1 Tax=Clostridium omnivorum TaxID=1604902 RepID=A0ABQ5N643_9CLOT|nr:hypothetical protein [Clostridium sp. E14]GLC30704.1 hypothetical protein bsdE14_21140 [Clostridium sp. E14]
MDKLKKYRKIRRRLETISLLIAIIVGNGISSYLGIGGKKFISLDTALNLAIVVGIALVLNIVAIRIADNWYEKNMDK